MTYDASSDILSLHDYRERTFNRIFFLKNSRNY